ncbi:FmdB family zinc ribbon protein [Micromonospora sp. WMMD558]|uniref:FmdB family zinc ribbon protein n=1 Tax=unclassified Micromonospora TaxID=2617518 RepID=UPI0012B4F4B1|nr:FmdB family zinc ribbon protein [Micromonospora sp. WMMC415]QGN45552.1 FmdB family transcriptional regulator [Micromonospora sp. WMMC415]
MPTYQYACTACGHQLEAVQSFSDEPLTECPTCEGRLRKLFNSVGIVFKGSGFYRTDSRSSGSDPGSGTSASKPAAGSDSGSSSSSSTSTSTSSSSNGSSGSTTKAPAASSASSS